jgi:putative transposase
MACDIPDSPRKRSCDFRPIVAALLAHTGLPFATILSAEKIERVFAKYGGLFGGNGIYTTAVMVWSFLAQVLRDGKEASCQAAVARVVSFCEQQGIAAPTADTGDYCRARAKLPQEALRELSCEVAEELEQAAEDCWLWKGKHAKLIDGFTFTMPDTPANQAEYPQQRGQLPGVGLPIARTVAVLSLATGCVLNAAYGPYRGKETGETALLRSIMSSLKAGDVAVMDRYYCSFMMIALAAASRRT